MIIENINKTNANNNNDIWQFKEDDWLFLQITFEVINFLGFIEGKKPLCCELNYSR